MAARARGKVVFLFCSAVGSVVVPQSVHPTSVCLCAWNLHASERPSVVLGGNSHGKCLPLQDGAKDQKGESALSVRCKLTSLQASTMVISIEAQLLNTLVQTNQMFSISVLAVWALLCMLQHNMDAICLHSVCTIVFSIACLRFCSMYVCALISQLSGASFELYLRKLYTSALSLCRAFFSKDISQAASRSMPGQTSTVKKAARGTQRPAKTPTTEDGPRPGTAPRTVRPRQLHVNDKVCQQHACETRCIQKATSAACE